MSTPAQVLANRSNARASTGPVTAEGKATVSRNSVKLGLFSVNAFIQPGEQPEFDELSRGLTAELGPQTALELILVREIIHASWRLRRCALSEIGAETGSADQAHRPPLGRPLCAVNEAGPDHLQLSIDRARAAAHRTLFRSLNELRRLRAAQPGPFDSFDSERTGGHSGRALCAAAAKEARRGITDIRLNHAFDLARPDLATPDLATPDLATPHLAKQTQFDACPAPPSAPSIPRNALCPCGSGDKFKRCCGKNAPPVLGTPAAAR